MFCNIPLLFGPLPVSRSLPLSVEVLSRHIADPHSSSLLLLLVGPPGRVPAAVKTSRMRHRRATPPASITLPRAPLRRKGGRAAAVECSVLQATPPPLRPPPSSLPRSLPPALFSCCPLVRLRAVLRGRRAVADSGSSWSGAGDRPSQGSWSA